MAKTLTLLRHAKSSRDDPRLSDINRPLAERGRRDAPRMALWMVRHGIVPDLVLCSTSVRTRETLALVTPALPTRFEVRFDETLYHAEAAHLLRTAQALPDHIEHVLLVGHNPGFHDLALQLARAGDRRLRDRLAEKFSTCGCAVLRAPVDTWAELAETGAVLLHWMSPKLLT